MGSVKYRVLYLWDRTVEMGVGVLYFLLDKLFGTLSTSSWDEYPDWKEGESRD